MKRTICESIVLPDRLCKRSVRFCPLTIKNLNNMNFRLFFLIAAVISTSGLQAQWNSTVYLAAGPSQSIQSTMVDVTDEAGNDFALLPEKQSMTLAAGVGLERIFNGGFFLAGELQYNTSGTDYTMTELTPGAEYRQTLHLTHREHRLAVPMSVGVWLGNFRVHSGVSANFVLGTQSDFDDLEYFADNSSSAYMGWHAGLGYQIGPIELEARYTQDFRNHAQGYTFNGKSSDFYGNRNQWLFAVKYRFTMKE